MSYRNYLKQEKLIAPMTARRLKIIPSKESVAFWKWMNRLNREIPLNFLRGVPKIKGGDARREFVVNLGKNTIYDYEAIQRFNKYDSFGMQKGVKGSQRTDEEIESIGWQAGVDDVFEGSGIGLDRELIEEWEPKVISYTPRPVCEEGVTPWGIFPLFNLAELGKECLWIEGRQTGTKLSDFEKSLPKALLLNRFEWKASKGKHRLVDIARLYLDYDEDDKKRAAKQRAFISRVDGKLKEAMIKLLRAANLTPHQRKIAEARWIDNYTFKEIVRHFGSGEGNHRETMERVKQEINLPRRLGFGKWVEPERYVHNLLKRVARWEILGLQIVKIPRWQREVFPDDPEYGQIVQMPYWSVDAVPSDYKSRMWWKTWDDEWLGVHPDTRATEKPQNVLEQLFNWDTTLESEPQIVLITARMGNKDFERPWITLPPKWGVWKKGEEGYTRFGVGNIGEPAWISERVPYLDGSYKTLGVNHDGRPTLRGTFIKPKPLPEESEKLLGGTIYERCNNPDTIWWANQEGRLWNHWPRKTWYPAGKNKVYRCKLDNIECEHLNYPECRKKKRCEHKQVKLILNAKRSNGAKDTGGTLEKRLQDSENERPVVQRDKPLSWSEVLQERKPLWAIPLWKDGKRRCQVCFNEDTHEICFHCMFVWTRGHRKTHFS